MSLSHEELQRLFQLALEAEPTVRESILSQHCSSEAASRVLAMVATAESNEFLGSPTRDKSGTSNDPDATLDVGSPQEQPGKQIGRYKLLQQIGEGGFGTVWMAEQREPVKRRVALKIIKLGMDTKQVIARFEAERQALAMMDHPNIARVLDAGSTDAGRPFFVMEYIRGIPIIEYCDNEKLDTHSRLDLFSTTCKAIQHAHQKGIIHRDIKPSNVLVTLHDGEPVPKVIDFGIAKATNAELTNKTLFTEHRQMIGTPAYMSPEQAEMSGLDIDTRADIYSLGVLLYELLTGTTPFDSKSLMAAGYAEMMRMIREEEPHKPSTRLSSLGDTGARTAQQRHTDVRRLSLVLKGDLDWIVMKCLEKDRTRRYETANGLAADIERHLTDEPVVAGPPSASYKLQKFMRRNRGKVATVAMLVALLVLGMVSTGIALQVALDERDQKDQALGEKGIALDEKGRALLRVEEALERTRVLALTMASAEAAGGDAMRALLLAREAARTSLSPGVVTQLHSAIQGSLERKILRGHEDTVLTAEFSPSGTSILTASSDKTARLWNLDGREIATLRGHSGALHSATFSPSGDRILTVSHDWTARIWNLDGEELARVRGEKFQLHSARFSPRGDRFLTVDGRATFDASRKGGAEVGTSVRIWDLQGRELAVIGEHETPVVTAVFSQSGDHILTASSDMTCLRDAMGQEIAILRGHDGPVNAAAFSPAGDRVVTVSSDKTARLWNLQGQELVVFHGHQDFVDSVVFSPVGDQILTTSWRDRSARLWDLEGKELATIRGHEPGIRSATFSPSGDRILTASLGTAQVWDLRGTELAVLRGQDQFFSSFVFSPSGDQILTAGDDAARLWDVEGKEIAVIRGHEMGTVSAVYSPSGDRILTASYDNSVRLWDLRGKELAMFRKHDRSLFCASFSPAGDRIVTGGDGLARVWTLDGEELLALRGHAAMVRTAVFSPSGNRILTASHDNTARLWDLEGNELVVFRHPGDYNPMASGPEATCVTSAAFSPGGNRIITTSFDNTARLWDIEGKELVVLRGHEKSVMSAAFSPSGDRIITASKDRTARLWDCNGTELAVFRGHEKQLMTARFSPSGDRIVTASMDSTARLWDLEGNELATLRGHKGPLMSACFSPSGDRIITAADDVRVWLTHGEDLLELADERVSRELNAQERRRYEELLGGAITNR